MKLLTKFFLVAQIISGTALAAQSGISLPKELTTLHNALNPDCNPEAAGWIEDAQVYPLDDYSTGRDLYILPCKAGLTHKTYVAYEVYKGFMPAYPTIPIAFQTYDSDLGSFTQNYEGHNVKFDPATKTLTEVIYHTGAYSGDRCTGQLTVIKWPGDRAFYVQEVRAGFCDENSKKWPVLFKAKK